MTPRLAVIVCAPIVGVGCAHRPDSARLPLPTGAVDDKDSREGAEAHAAPPEGQDAPPFLGVAEDRVRKFEDQNPDIDFRLRGFATMSKVQSADYTDYFRLKEAGRIDHEEVRGKFVYFAVTKLRILHLPPAGPGTADEVAFEFVERFKAPLPPPGRRRARPP